MVHRARDHARGGLVRKAERSSPKSGRLSVYLHGKMGGTHADAMAFCLSLPSRVSIIKAKPFLTLVVGGISVLLMAK